MGGGAIEWADTQLHANSRLSVTSPPPQRCPELTFAVAADRFLAGFPDPLEIPRIRTANTYGVVDAIAETVRKDGVVHVSVATLLERGKCSWVGIQSLNSSLTGSK